MGKSGGVGHLFLVQGISQQAGFFGFVAPHHFQTVFVGLHPHQGVANGAQGGASTKSHGESGCGGEYAWRRRSAIFRIRIDQDRTQSLAV